jgi:signal recognition particle GTPase
MDQLETLGKSMSVPVFMEREAAALDICKNGLERARRE